MDSKPPSQSRSLMKVLQVTMPSSAAQLSQTAGIFSGTHRAYSNTKTLPSSPERSSNTHHIISKNNSSNGTKQTNKNNPQPKKNHNHSHSDLLMNVFPTSAANSHRSPNAIQTQFPKSQIDSQKLFYKGPIVIKEKHSIHQQAPTQQRPPSNTSSSSNQSLSVKTEQSSNSSNIQKKQQRNSIKKFPTMTIEISNTSKSLSQQQPQVQLQQNYPSLQQQQQQSYQQQKQDYEQQQQQQIQLQQQYQQFSALSSSSQIPSSPPHSPTVIQAPEENQPHHYSLPTFSYEHEKRLADILTKGSSYQKPFQKSPSSRLSQPDLSKSIIQSKFVKNIPISPDDQQLHLHSISSQLDEIKHLLSSADYSEFLPKRKQQSLLQQHTSNTMTSSNTNRNMMDSFRQNNIQNPMLSSGSIENNKHYYRQQFSQTPESLQTASTNRMYTTESIITPFDQVRDLRCEMSELIATRLKEKNEMLHQQNELLQAKNETLQQQASLNKLETQYAASQKQIETLSSELNRWKERAEELAKKHIEAVQLNQKYLSEATETQSQEQELKLQVEMLQTQCLYLQNILKDKDAELQEKNDIENNKIAKETLRLRDEEITALKEEVKKLKEKEQQPNTNSKMLLQQVQISQGTINQLSLEIEKYKSELLLVQEHSQLCSIQIHSSKHLKHVSGLLKAHRQLGNEQTEEDKAREEEFESLKKAYKELKDKQKEKETDITTMKATIMQESSLRKNLEQEIQKLKKQQQLQDENRTHLQAESATQVVIGIIERRKNENAATQQQKQEVQQQTSDSNIGNSQELSVYKDLVQGFQQQINQMHLEKSEERKKHKQEVKQLKAELNMLQKQWNSGVQEISRLNKVLEFSEIQETLNENEEELQKMKSRNKELESMNISLQQIQQQQQEVSLDEKAKQESVFAGMIESETAKRKNIEAAYKRLQDDYEKVDKLHKASVENLKKLQQRLAQSESLRVFLENEITEHRGTIAVLQEKLSTPPSVKIASSICSAKMLSSLNESAGESESCGAMEPEQLLQELQDKINENGMLMMRIDDLNEEVAKLKQLNSEAQKQLEKQQQNASKAAADKSADDNEEINILGEENEKLRNQLSEKFIEAQLGELETSQLKLHCEQLQKQIEELTQKLTLKEQIENQAMSVSLKIDEEAAGTTVEHAVLRKVQDVLSMDFAGFKGQGEQYVVGLAESQFQMPTLTVHDDYTEQQQLGSKEEQALFDLENFALAFVKQEVDD